VPDTLKAALIGAEAAGLRGCQTDAENQRCALLAVDVVGESAPEFAWVVFADIQGAVRRLDVRIDAADPEGERWLAGTFAGSIGETAETGWQAIEADDIGTVVPNRRDLRFGPTVLPPSPIRGSPD